MPHTALAQLFKDMYVVLEEANQRKIPFEQVVYEWKRKAAHPLALPHDEPITSPFHPPVQASRSVLASRIAIIGGGLAGLTCAYRLEQAGFKPVVFEADHKKIPGRVDTRRGAFDDGQSIERGGMLIDTGHAALRELIEELGLALNDLLAAELAGTEPCYYFDGEPYTLADATRDFQAVVPKLNADLKAAGFPTVYNHYTPRGLELDRMSVVDWIEESVPGGKLSKFGKLIDIACNIEYGAESSQQSALNFLYLHDYIPDGEKFSVFGVSDERYHVRGGNDQIVHRLMDRLAPGTLQRGCRLIAIAEAADGSYRLTLQDRSGTHEVAAEHVVLTIPFSILRSSVDYSKAGFRPLKLAAIEELGMGANSKLHVQFTDRHWTSTGCNGDTITDGGYQNTFDVTRGQPGKSGILVAYTGGNVADGMNLGSLPERAQQFLHQLEPVIPGMTQRWNGKVTRDYWPGNPFSLGSYAYRKVGQYTKFTGIEGECEGSKGACHFAGEHTSVVFQGYMNGAVESGERAAAEIMEALRAADESVE
ncbi:NAD(P)/FAD-dependent oxidoreductase [Paenibacillus sp. CF384]|uniref:flavin monoamine oxidase family protein n=1 Tax=Paenibacillus sp. CF384 TaxID=1884382 RepID=UPI00089BC17B|nr:NAD(P)/FAD-dependent oxidoreductase [Paenibacillus sp. CF384]SDW95204.1 monoamine oxidase [Paenibacillus sp. CF384]